MHFLPYPDVAGRPHVVVDGPSQPGTLLCLSHWPRSGTPAILKDDVSAQIAFRYLDHPELRVDADAVTNNHFDEDGCISAWTLCHPAEALARREFLVDAALAGDFGTYRHREAARLAFALFYFYDAERSPIDKAAFTLPYPELCAIQYREALARFPELLAHPERFRDLWGPDDATLDAGEAAVRSGAVSIEETPALDLAVVTIPPGLDVLPMAITNVARGFCLLRVQGRTMQVQYRYETWIQYCSRRPRPRVDFAPLAEELSREESGARWEFDGADGITPRLHLLGAPESRIAPARFVARVKEFLAAAPPAWDPYDNEGMRVQGRGGRRREVRLRSYAAGGSGGFGSAVGSSSRCSTRISPRSWSW